MLVLRAHVAVERAISVVALTFFRVIRAYPLKKTVKKMFFRHLVYLSHTFRFKAVGQVFLCENSFLLLLNNLLFLNYDVRGPFDK